MSDIWPEDFEEKMNAAESKQAYEITRLRAENERLRVLLHDAVWTTAHKKDPHWLSDALAALKENSDE